MDQVADLQSLLMYKVCSPHSHVLTVHIGKMEHMVTAVLAELYHESHLHYSV